MSNILEKIIKTKINEIEYIKKKEDINFLKEKINQQELPRNFILSIENQHKKNKIAIIAEIKKASPSKGIIREIFNPIEIAKIYDKSGASCISILTDEVYFLGSLSYIEEVKKITKLPILRKDFIIDEYQIHQSRAYGADAILLIAGILSQKQLKDYEQLANSLGMQVLIEIHNKLEINKCNKLKTKLIGINNRNLKTFDVNLDNSIKLSKYLLNKIIVSESGINDKKDILKLKENGIKTFLIGEYLMTKNDINLELKNLLN